ncbi:MAG: hypothetical protein QM811_29470 [Pirellulales bacterium]
MAAAPLGNGRSSVAAIAELGQCVRLNETEHAADPPWEAYPLAVAKPDHPHVVELEYPTHLAQQLGISVVEPNAAGSVQALGLDSGVTVAPQPGTPAGWSRHRLVFWPRTKTPYLLLTNRAMRGPAYFGKIRVLAGPTHLPAADTSRGFDPNERIWAAAWLRPLFPEQFGTHEAVDTWSGRGLDDWQTFYEGASRLLEYSRYAGQNMVVVAALADGSAVYPSRHLEPTPRYDTGVFFDHGGDPIRKDVLELLARMCDREGQRLLVGLQFAAPLPELEAFAPNDPNGVGIRLEGVEGKPYHLVHAPRRGLAPYYNPLDERVQDAVARVVREVAVRYARHPSFSGVSLEIGGDSYLQFPGEYWGLDDRTFTRFTQAARLDIPAAGPTRHWLRAKYLAENPQAKELWLRWRTTELRAFHLRLQNELRAARADARLVLAPTQPWDTPEALEDALPHWNGQNSSRTAAREIGLGHGRSRARRRSGVVDEPAATTARRLGRLVHRHRRVGRLGAARDAERVVVLSRTATVATAVVRRQESVRKRQNGHVAVDAIHTFGNGESPTLGERARANGRFVDDRRRAPSVLRPGRVRRRVRRRVSQIAAASLSNGQRRDRTGRRSHVDSRRTNVVLRGEHRRGRRELDVKLDTTVAVRPIELSGYRNVAAPQNRAWKLELGPYDLIAVRFRARFGSRRRRPCFRRRYERSSNSG